jgi:2-polyprenyl-6-methoxyphenol hydroxylase-like FAD-dependent oxidoreductase
MAIMSENEEGEWILSMGGRFGEYPPTDEDGFRSFARSLHSPRIYELIKDAERVSEIGHYGFPTSVRRHYELLHEVPEKFIVVGDALTSLNPLYAQGMTSAALQVQTLHDLLKESGEGSLELERLARVFFTKASEVISVPWMMAASSDFAYPQTKGERPPGLNDSSQYLAAAEALSANDVEVQKLIWEVFTLARPLSALMEEPLRSRVLAQMQA